MSVTGRLPRRTSRNICASALPAEVARLESVAKVLSITLAAHTAYSGSWKAPSSDLYALNPAKIAPCNKLFFTKLFTSLVACFYNRSAMSKSTSIISPNFINYSFYQWKAYYSLTWPINLVWAANTFCQSPTCWSSVGRRGSKIAAYPQTPMASVVFSTEAMALSTSRSNAL